MIKYKFNGFRRGRSVAGAGVHAALQAARAAAEAAEAHEHDDYSGFSVDAVACEEHGHDKLEAGSEDDAGATAVRL